MGVTEDDPQKGLKNELKHLFSKLCGKLDALCNFHYTPKAAIPEMKVSKMGQQPRGNTPSSYLSPSLGRVLLAGFIIFR